MTEIKFKLGGLLEFVEETKPKDEIVALVTLTYRDFIITARGETMAYTLASGMQVHLSVSYVDAAGNPAAVDGPVQWATSDTAIATVTAEVDTAAVLKTVGPIGQIQVTVTADVDLGAGVKNLVTPVDVAVVAGEAVAGTIEPVGPAEPVTP